MTSPETAIIDKVHIRRAFGPVEIDRFAIQMHPGPGKATGTSDKPLADELYSAVEGKAINGLCGGEGDDIPPVAELAMQFKRTASGDAGVDGIIIEYTVGSKRYVLTNNIFYGLCDPTSTSTEPQLSRECDDT